MKKTVGGSGKLLIKSRVKTGPGAMKVAVIAFILPALFLSSVVAGKKKKEPEETWRTYEAPYNRVWNRMVKIVVGRWEYAVRAADPEQGYLATWPKTTHPAGKYKTRTTMNVNVKEAPEGTLVTVSCVIEEYRPVKGADKGRWMAVPSDGSCEKRLLDALAQSL